MIAAIVLSSLMFKSCPQVLTPAIARTVLAVDPNLVHAIIENESAGDPNAVSSAGAVGLGQLMPSTARSVDVCNSRDPAQNVIGTARYLAYLIGRYNDIRLVVAAYNAGPGAVDRYGDVPPYQETKTYVARVLSSYARFSSTSAATPSPLPHVSPQQVPTWPGFGQWHTILGAKR